MAEHIIIALDAMGGDKAPWVVLEGARLALKEELNSNPRSAIRFLMVGNETKIKPYLKKHPSLESKTTVVHTEEYVHSDENPADAIRKKKDSSMRLALDALKDGHADALVSAGNSGALMGMSKFVLKMIKGIHRPAMVASFPNVYGGAPTVMLDLGANSDCDVDNLLQFAVMGKAYAQIMHRIQEPTIGLLNIGSEVQKGNDVVRATAEALNSKIAPVKYKGFVEGNDILMGKVNVIVTDGFSGNIALKSIEGVGNFIKKIIKDAIKKHPMVYLALPFLWSFYRYLSKTIDTRRENGAMLIGIQGIVVKSHGGTDAQGFSWAIRRTIRLVEGGVNERIAKNVENLVNQGNAMSEGE